MQHVKCKICNADDNDLVVIKNNYRIVRCRNCQLIYVNPRPAPEALIRLYDLHHIRYKMDREQWEDLLHRSFSKIAFLLSRIFWDKRYGLTIGYGHNQFEESMKKYNWTVCRLDPSAKDIICALGDGQNVVEHTLGSDMQDDLLFSAVTAFYIIENLSDPLATLKKAYAAMKPGGIIAILTPLISSYLNYLSTTGAYKLYDPPFHLYVFSKQTIRLLLKTAGFTSIRFSHINTVRPDNNLDRALFNFSYNFTRLLSSFFKSELDIAGISRLIIGFKPAKDNRKVDSLKDFMRNEEWEEDSA